MPTEAVLGTVSLLTQVSQRQRMGCLLLAASMVGLLFYLGSQAIAVGLFAEPWDKVAHFCVFGALSVLLWVGLGGHSPWLVIGLMACLGALDEWHQSSLPGRSADVGDFLIDVGAATLVVFLLQRWRKWAKTAVFCGRPQKSVFR
jgi:VanZ like family